MTTDTETPRRAAVAHLNYPGDITADVVGQIVGPNVYREHYVAVDASYDSTSDRTRVGFAIATVADFERAFGS